MSIFFQTKTAVIATTLLLSCLIISACGQKGELYWPEEGPSHPKQDHDLVKKEKSDAG